MGLLSALNRFTFGRKSQAAWNALMASYTFLQLDGATQRVVLDRASDIPGSQVKRTWEQHAT